MGVKIRLARAGRKKHPFYKLVVADARAPRDGKFIEKIGVYDPLLLDTNEARFVVNQERAKHWLSVGAQPSGRVAKLFSKVGLT